MHVNCISSCELFFKNLTNHSSLQMNLGYSSFCQKYLYMTIKNIHTYVKLHPKQIIRARPMFAQKYAEKFYVYTTIHHLVHKNAIFFLYLLGKERFVFRKIKKSTIFNCWIQRNMCRISYCVWCLLDSSKCW